METFGLREFQLYLLAFMPYSDHVATALATLDASWDEAKQTLKSTKQTDLGQMIHKVDVEISMLGDPEYTMAVTEEDSDMPERLRGSTVYAFNVPVFRDYAYLINVTPQGYAWGQRLGRRPQSTAPRIETLEDLQPWVAVKDEVLPALEDAEQLDAFSYYEVYSGYIRQARTGERIKILAQFDVELLQWAQPADETTG